MDTRKIIDTGGGGGGGGRRRREGQGGDGRSDGDQKEGRREDGGNVSGKAQSNPAVHDGGAIHSVPLLLHQNNHNHPLDGVGNNRSNYDHQHEQQQEQQQQQQQHALHDSSSLSMVSESAVEFMTNWLTNYEDHHESQHQLTGPRSSSSSHEDQAHGCFESVRLGELTTSDLAKAVATESMAAAGVESLPITTEVNNMHFQHHHLSFNKTTNPLPLHRTASLDLNQTMNDALAEFVGSADPATNMSQHHHLHHHHHLEQLQMTGITPMVADNGLNGLVSSVHGTSATMGFHTDNLNVPSALSSSKEIRNSSSGNSLETHSVGIPEEMSSFKTLLPASSRIQVVSATTTTTTTLAGGTATRASEPSLDLSNETANNAHNRHAGAPGREVDLVQHAISSCFSQEETTPFGLTVGDSMSANMGQTQPHLQSMPLDSSVDSNANVMDPNAFMSIPNHPMEPHLGPEPRLLLQNGNQTIPVDYNDQIVFSTQTQPSEVILGENGFLLSIKDLKAYQQQQQQQQQQQPGPNLGGHFGAPPQSSFHQVLPSSGILTTTSLTSSRPIVFPTHMFSDQGILGKQTSPTTTPVSPKTHERERKRRSSKKQNRQRQQPSGTTPSVGSIAQSSPITAPQRIVYGHSVPNPSYIQWPTANHQVGIHQQQLAGQCLVHQQQQQQQHEQEQQQQLQMAHKRQMLLEKQCQKHKVAPKQEQKAQLIDLTGDKTGTPSPIPFAHYSTSSPAQSSARTSSPSPDSVIPSIASIASTLSENDSFSPAAVDVLDFDQFELAQLVEDVGYMVNEQEKRSAWVPTSSGSSAKMPTFVPQEKDEAALDVIKTQALIYRNLPSKSELLSNYRTKDTQSIADELARSVVERALEHDKKKLFRRKLDNEPMNVKDESHVANRFVEVAVNRMLDVTVNTLMEEFINDLASLAVHGCESDLSQVSNTMVVGEDLLQTELSDFLREVGVPAGDTSQGLHRNFRGLFSRHGSEGSSLASAVNYRLSTEGKPCPPQPTHNPNHVCTTRCKETIRKQKDLAVQINLESQANGKKARLDERRKRNELGLLLSSLREKVYHCRCTDCQAERVAKGEPEPSDPIELRPLELPGDLDANQIPIPKKKGRGRPRLYPRIEDLWKRSGDGGNDAIENLKPQEDPTLDKNGLMSHTKRRLGRPRKMPLLPPSPKPTDSSDLDQAADYRSAVVRKNDQGKLVLTIKTKKSPEVITDSHDLMNVTSSKNTPQTELQLLMDDNFDAAATNGSTVDPPEEPPLASTTKKSSLKRVNDRDSKKRRREARGRDHSQSRTKKSKDKDLRRRDRRRASQLESQSEDMANRSVVLPPLASRPTSQLDDAGISVGKESKESLVPSTSVDTRSANHIGNVECQSPWDANVCSPSLSLYSEPFHLDHNNPVGGFVNGGHTESSSPYDEKEEDLECRSLSDRTGAEGQIPCPTMDPTNDESGNSQGLRTLARTKNNNNKAVEEKNMHPTEKCSSGQKDEALRSSSPSFISGPSVLASNLTSLPYSVPSNLEIRSNAGVNKGHDDELTGFALMQRILRESDARGQNKFLKEQLPQTKGATQQMHEHHQPTEKLSNRWLDPETDNAQEHEPVEIEAMPDAEQSPEDAFSAPKYLTTPTFDETMAEVSDRYSHDCDGLFVVPFTPDMKIQQTPDSGCGSDEEQHYPRGGEILDHHHQRLNSHRQKYPIESGNKVDSFALTENEDKEFYSHSRVTSATSAGVTTAAVVVTFSESQSEVSNKSDKTDSMYQVPEKSMPSTTASAKCWDLDVDASYGIIGCYAESGKTVTNSPRSRSVESQPERDPPHVYLGSSSTRADTPTSNDESLWAGTPQESLQSVIQERLNTINDGNDPSESVPSRTEEHEGNPIYSDTEDNNNHDDVEGDDHPQTTTTTTTATTTSAATSPSSSKRPALHSTKRAYSHEGQLSSCQVSQDSERTRKDGTFTSTLTYSNKLNVSFGHRSNQSDNESPMSSPTTKRLREFLENQAEMNQFPIGSTLELNHFRGTSSGLDGSSSEKCAKRARRTKGKTNTFTKASLIPRAEREEKNMNELNEETNGNQREDPNDNHDSGPAVRAEEFEQDQRGEGDVEEHKQDSESYVINGAQDGYPFQKGTLSSTEKVPCQEGTNNRVSKSFVFPTTQVAASAPSPPPLPPPPFHPSLRTSSSLGCRSDRLGSSPPRSQQQEGTINFEIDDVHSTYDEGEALRRGKIASSRGPRENSSFEKCQGNSSHSNFLAHTMELNGTERENSPSNRHVSRLNSSGLPELPSQLSQTKNSSVLRIDCQYAKGNDVDNTDNAVDDDDDSHYVSHNPFPSNSVSLVSLNPTSCESQEGRRNAISKGLVKSAEERKKIASILVAVERKSDPEENSTTLPKHRGSSSSSFIERFGQTLRQQTQSHGTPRCGLPRLLGSMEQVETDRKTEETDVLRSATRHSGMEMSDSQSSSSYSSSLSSENYPSAAELIQKRRNVKGFTGRRLSWWRKKMEQRRWRANGKNLHMDHDDDGEDVEDDDDNGDDGNGGGEKSQDNNDKRITDSVTFPLSSRNVMKRRENVGGIFLHQSKLSKLDVVTSRGGRALSPSISSASFSSMNDQINEMGNGTRSPLSLLAVSKTGNNGNRKGSLSSSSSSSLVSCQGIGDLAISSRSSESSVPILMKQKVAQAHFQSQDNGSRVSWNGLLNGREPPLDGKEKGSKRNTITTTTSSTSTSPSTTTTTTMMMKKKEKSEITQRVLLRLPLLPQNGQSQDVQISEKQQPTSVRLTLELKWKNQQQDGSGSWRMKKTRKKKKKNRNKTKPVQAIIHGFPNSGPTRKKSHGSHHSFPVLKPCVVRLERIPQDWEHKVRSERDGPMRHEVAWGQNFLSEPKSLQEVGDNRSQTSGHEEDSKFRQGTPTQSLPPPPPPPPPVSPPPPSPPSPRQTRVDGSSMFKSDKLRVWNKRREEINSAPTISLPGTKNERATEKLDMSRKIDDGGTRRGHPRVTGAEQRGNGIAHQQQCPVRKRKRPPHATGCDPKINSPARNNSVSDPFQLQDEVVSEHFLNSGLSNPSSASAVPFCEVSDMFQVEDEAFEREKMVVPRSRIELLSAYFQEPNLRRMRLKTPFPQCDDSSLSNLALPGWRGIPCHPSRNTPRSQGKISVISFK